MPYTLKVKIKNISELINHEMKEKDVDINYLITLLDKLYNYAKEVKDYENETNK